MMDARAPLARERNGMPGRSRYSTVAIILHWLIAILVAAQIILGRTMTSLSPGLRQFELYQLHKSIGITILGLTLFRLGWRLFHPPPPPPAHLMRWERVAARATHFGLYGVMIGIPLLGWATVSTSPLNIPTLLWDAVPFPDLPLEPGSRQSDMWASGHRILAWGALLLILLHVAAAFRHHLIVGDDVLARMLPIFKQRNSRGSAG